MDLNVFLYNPACQQGLWVGAQDQSSRLWDPGPAFTAVASSHASKVMLKILQVRLQQYVNHELPDVQAGFKKGRGTRDKIFNILLDHRKSKRAPEKHLFLLY